MARLTIKEAVEISPVSESTLRRDIKSGKVSSEKDDRGRRRIDTAELARVYGQLRQSTDSNDTQMTAVDIPNNATSGNENETPDTHIDNPKIVAILEGQVQDLKSQLAQATEREAKLLDLTDRLQKQNEVLMLPSPDEKRPNWLQRLFGITASRHRRKGEML